MQDDKRTYPSQSGDERTSLSGFLQFQRETLAMKCAGLTPEQLRRPAVPTSDLTLLGLVRHLAEVERSWFRRVLKDEVAPPHWPGPNAGEFAEFEVETADPDEAFRIWHEECVRSRATVETAESLEIRGSYGDEVFSLRHILTHVIEEYARHNGHADLLRESIDGVTGE
ncbi:MULTISPECIES: DinB family protein [unclassified Streptomyces]|uniref:DinB family protein n=1 Tax=unclassified Streptomyces TaxID=2593676 RepID=UPI002E1388C0|nr:DinB family protein [Streptomyces sp. NBC_01240]WSU20704.1 DinB family protein [Streptomyces sp. NBC_01108]